MNRRAYACGQSDRSHSNRQNLDVIDWDNTESDPAREWGQFDEEDKKYVRENYPDDYAKYFSQLNED